MRVPLLLALVSSLFAGTSIATVDTPRAASPPPRAVYALPDDFEESGLKTFTAFSQTDPEWRHARLGKRTLGSQGCLASVYAMFATAAGEPIDPGELVVLFHRKGLIERGGRISYRIDRAVPLVIEKRIPIGSRKKVAPIVRRHLRSGRFVALKLDRDPGPGFHEHWVAVTGMIGDDIAINDPAGGRETTLGSRYRTARVVEVRVIRPLPLG